MKEYIRETPQFSLCGLNCCLCPRYRTTGSSRCPGCGGEEFALKHPSCGVISCSQRHNGVEYCFQCQEYPCDRYTGAMDKDSFVTYQNVLQDMEKAKNLGLDAYLSELAKKNDILNQLLDHWDSGREKAYYCLAVNLLPLEELEAVMIELNKNRNPQKDSPPADTARNSQIAKEHIDALAERKGISLKLRR